MHRSFFQTHALATTPKKLFFQVLAPKHHKRGENKIEMEATKPIVMHRLSVSFPSREDNVRTRRSRSQHLQAAEIRPRKAMRDSCSLFIASRSLEMTTCICDLLFPKRTITATSCPDLRQYSAYNYLLPSPSLCEY